MKKSWILLVLCLFLTGCGSAEVFETLGNVKHEGGGTAVMAPVSLKLPEQAAAEAFSGEEGTLYECEGYTLVLQTVAAGDFARTVKALSGFQPEKLTILESRTGQAKRYDWVWTAAGEDGDMLCRATVLDDGKYHYCLSAVADAKEAGSLTAHWNELFGSFCLGSD